MSSTAEIDVAIVGAGPYGLSLAAASRQPRTIVFGHPLETWERMPRDMQLRAAPREMSLSAGGGRGSLAAWESVTGSEDGPLSVERFLSYGRWFLDRFVPALVPHDVVAVRETRCGRLHVETPVGDYLTRAVVVSVGITPFPYAPPSLEPLIDGDTIAFATGTPGRALVPGERVGVIGGGQSAVEAAVRAAAAGAEPTLIARNRVHWFANREPFEPRGPAGQRLYDLLYPAVGYGPPPLNRLVLEPDLFATLPHGLARRLAARLLRPGASPWLRAAVETGVTVREGVAVREVQPGPPHRLVLSTGEVVEVDRLLLGTGYRFQLDRLRFLAAELRSRIDVRDGWPVLDRFFRSTDRRFSLVGYPAEGRFGPVSRFVLGVPFTTARVTESFRELRS